MHKVFPLSFKGKNLKAVILSTLIYTLIFFAVAAVVGCLNIAFDLAGTLGIIINVARQLVLLYCAAGIVVAVLNACDLLEKKD
ncbi:MAG: hypothetical protein IJ002_07335 [Clostridia bacterium]|nr:hypothetical protein [Clostridia bacterium]